MEEVSFESLAEETNSFDKGTLSPGDILLQYITADGSANK